MSETTPSYSPYSATRRYSRRIGAGLAVAAVLGAGGCASADRELEITRAEAHFAASCPSGGAPGIIEVSHSGVLPRDLTGKRTTRAVVRLACLDGQAPVVVKDTERDGLCLGYGKESHLIVAATQPGQEGPEFFVSAAGEIGVTGSNNLTVSKATLHHHDLADPFNQVEYKRNCQ